MIPAALLLAALQPLPAHAHAGPRVERAWRTAAPAEPSRGGRRLRALRLTVQGLDAGAGRGGPTGL